MVKLQDDVLLKEQSKALAIRQRFEDRTKRFLDAKQRTIGVDKEYLDKQVEEKRNELKMKQQEEEYDAIHLEQICKCLEEREIAYQELKQKELQEVHATVREQLKQPKNNAIKQGGPLDLDHCGPSSIQTFQGEDPEYLERKTMQQQQLKLWCSEQEKENQGKLMEEARRDKEYSNYVISEDDIRCEIYELEKLDRARKEREVMVENMVLADEKRKRISLQLQREKELEVAEMSFIQSSPLFCEDTEYAKSTLSDNRVRPDHFKGFNTEKCKAIIAANASVAEEKALSLQREQELEAQWAIQEANMIQKMEEMEVVRKQLIKEDQKKQAEIITKQRQELKEKQDRMEKDRFGAIGVGFFQKFGTSCR